MSIKIGDLKEKGELQRHFLLLPEVLPPRIYAGVQVALALQRIVISSDKVGYFFRFIKVQCFVIKL